jgi:hypothetical protein
VSNSSGMQIEERGHTSSAPASGSRHRTRGAADVAIGIALGTALSIALDQVFFHRQRRSATQPASPLQPNNPRRAFVWREERDFGHGLLRIPPVSEPYPNLHLVDDITDGVFTTLPLVPHRPARSIRNQDG